MGHRNLEGNVLPDSPPKVAPESILTGPAPRRRLPLTHLLSGLSLLVLVILALMVLTDPLILGGPRLLDAFRSSDVATVELSMSGFRPKIIEAKAGTEVRLRLVNAEGESGADGGEDHQFAIDELGVSYVVKPKDELIISFTPTTPGTYTFYCDVCCGGKDSPAMRGTLRVTA